MNSRETDPYITLKARQDFNKAKQRATLSSVLNSFAPDREQLLSFDDVRQLLRPRGQAYRGMRTVEVDLIVGSEGRYRDFNRAFLPRREMLRHRWESVDRAHLKSIDLPPIKLYEIGGVYFVRDGNHRVSVARTQGREFIDAEIISLDSEIKLLPDMTKDDLRGAIIAMEKQQFFQDTKLGSVIPPQELDFTATGRYLEVLKHIQVHKYYINQDKTEEIPLEAAARSWYDHLFKPIIDLIDGKKLHARFPGRTKADLYMWMINHWDELKRRFGNAYPLERAVLDYSRRYGQGLWQRIKALAARMARR